MQIIETIKQFTKPLQGRLLPSNVWVWIAYIVIINLAINIFYTEIEGIISEKLIKNTFEYFKGKSSLSLDVLLVSFLFGLGFWAYRKAYLGYVFSDVSLFLIWVAFILYGRFYSNPAWQAEPLFLIKQLTYANILAWGLESAFLFIFLYNYLKTYYQDVERYLIFVVLSIFPTALILSWFGYDFAILESIILISILYIAPFQHLYLTFGVLRTSFILVLAALLMLYAAFPNDLIQYLLSHAIFVIILVNVLWFLLKKEQAKPNLNFFVEDTPTDNDSIGRKVFAQNLVEQLHSQTFTEAFTVGILGEWGAGKSQFMNYMRKESDEKSDVIYLDFSPWLQSHNTKLVVVQHFFEALAEKYKPYSSALSKQLNSYQHKLFEAVPATGGIGMIWKAAKDLLNDWLTNDIDSEKINEALKVINKKTVVFIDDLDRLHADEVLDILKVMRTAANFWNTVYIVGADKPRVMELLISKHSDEKFLDKFIQLEVHLTPIKKGTLWAEFVRMWNSSDVSKLISIDYIANNKEIADTFESHIKTYRDVKRLFNLVVSDYLFLNNKSVLIDLGDFIFLSVIKLISIETYRELYSKGFLLFVKDNKKSSRFCLFFDKIFQRGNSNTYYIRLYNTTSFPFYFSFARTEILDAILVALEDETIQGADKKIKLYASQNNADGCINYYAKEISLIAEYASNKSLAWALYYVYCIAYRLENEVKFYWSESESNKKIEQQEVGRLLSKYLEGEKGNDGIYYFFHWLIQVNMPDRASLFNNEIIFWLNKASVEHLPLLMVVIQLGIISDQLIYFINKNLSILLAGEINVTDTDISLAFFNEYKSNIYSFVLNKKRESCTIEEENLMNIYLECYKNKGRISNYKWTNDTRQYYEKNRKLYLKIQEDYNQKFKELFGS